MQGNPYSTQTPIGNAIRSLWQAYFTPTNRASPLEQELMREQILSSRATRQQAVADAEAAERERQQGRAYGRALADLVQRNTMRDQFSTPDATFGSPLPVMQGQAAPTNVSIGTAATASPAFRSPGPMPAVPVARPVSLQRETVSTIDESLAPIRDILVMQGRYGQLPEDGSAQLARLLVAAGGGNEAEQRQAQSILTGESVGPNQRLTLAGQQDVTRQDQQNAMDMARLESALAIEQDQASQLTEAAIEQELGGGFSGLEGTGMDQQAFSFLVDYQARKEAGEPTSRRDDLMASMLFERLSRPETETIGNRTITRPALNLENIIAPPGRTAPAAPAGFGVQGVQVGAPSAPLPAPTVPPASAPAPAGDIPGLPGSRVIAQGPTTGEDRLDAEFAKRYEELIPGGGYADAEKGLEQLMGVIQQIEGPSNIGGGALAQSPVGEEWLRTVFDPQSIDVQERVQEIAQRNLREILGGQFAQKEGEALIARAYNPRLDDAINAPRLRRLYRSMQEALQAQKAAADYYERNNMSLRGYQGADRITMDDIEAIYDRLSAEEGDTVGDAATTTPMIPTSDGQLDQSQLQKDKVYSDGSQDWRWNGETFELVE